MTIQFQHKGQKILGRLVYSDCITDAMILFPESNLGELGWSHFFLRKKNQWTSETFLKDKYPDTYQNLLLQLNSLSHFDDQFPQGSMNHFTNQSQPSY